MKKNLMFLLAGIFLLCFGCMAAEDFKVLHQVTGAIETNCYLIYGVKSKEAALVDPGGPVPTLVSFIKDNALDLKYILITHGHIDHVFGIPVIKKLFPQAKLCMHKNDYENLFSQLRWAIDHYGKEWLDQVKSDPETSKFLDFDMNSLGKPDIFAEDNSKLKLGSLEIKAIHTPGHSPGGTCYAIGNALFSGDVLFYRTVGRIDTQDGSKEEQIKSVRKLYALFPDATIVYPGHGQLTDIGSEKKENKKIGVTGGEWLNPNTP